MIRHTRALTFLVALALTTLTATSHAVENTWDYSVQVSSSHQSSPAQITLSWPQDTNGVPSSYTVYRRAPGSSDWGQGKTLAGSATSYVDADVRAGQAYEYRIVKAGASYSGYGYILTGIEAPLVDSRGKLVLVVDNTVAAPLASELSRLERDLVGDGWEVIRRDVGRTDSVANVKAVIKAAYDTDPANVKSVFLFGHVPVPYSGQFNPDGHVDHVGAWPADAFYGDMDGNWTDSSINFTQTLNTDKADAERMSNRPGDGKFDQTTLPSPVELQVGRVDLSNLPGRTTWGGPATFASEIELLRKYLDKDHAFRHRKVNPARRAILGDYFGQRGGEAFAASGFRSFAPLVGADKIRNLNKEFNDQRGVWIREAAAQDYLLAYGCGAGSYATIAGLGNTGIYNDGATTEMVQNDVRGVFNLLFGSWLGDWDHEDNILRAPLATSQGLVSVWSGRPHWFIHAMGLGETIGHSARLTMNNAGDYQTQINSAQNRVHIALMGDPTLRLHPVVPVGAINGAVNGSTVALTWGASADTAIVGYHVYRSDGGAFARLTALPTKELSYTDTNGSAAATYMVRAIKLESTPSGSYYNAAQGVFWSVATGSTGGSEIVATTPPSNNTGTGSTTTNPTDTTTPSTPPPTSPAAVSSDDIVWFDDALPLGAGGGASGGDAWNWIAANPAPFSGTVSHQSNIASGVHDHYFNWAGQTMAVAAGDKLFAYVYIDPANIPAQIMISWCSNNWEHRAYWGEDKINTGTNGTPSRYRVGALPAAGQWVRLEVPASAVGLEGHTVQGMSFSLFGGRVSWDRIGRSPTAAPADPSPAPAPVVAETIWFDDAVPAGGGTGTSGGDVWNWVASNPAPASGSKAHQSSVGTGLREHWFNWASPMKVSAGDVIFTYVYIDPANKPSQIMLSFVSDNWEHRAYWGENKINSGTNGTASRRYVGPLPAAGQWVRLEVAAKDIGLEGHNVAGMSFGTYDGRATYDKTGRASANSSGGGTTSPATGANTVTLAATDATATIGNDADTATLTFTRTGSTASALKVKFDLGGSAVKWIDYRRPEGDMPVDLTIPAGSASTSMKIRAVANVTNANPATVSFTLATDASYTLGTAKSASITLAPAGSSAGGSSGGSSDGSSGGTTTPPPTTTPPTQVPVEAINENAVARLPEVGDHRLRILSPTILELNRINTKQPDPAQPTSWNFVSGGTFNPPATSEFTVTVNGSAVTVKSVGFRRRVAYAQLNQRDLRIDNSLFLELSSNIPEGATVEVKNPTAALWPATFVFKGAASATRFNPAIHVNQEGYVPSFPKKAIIGYYLGNKGELEVNAAAGFYLVDARTGKVVHSGGLAARKETGYVYNQLPYQKVLEADFSAFSTPGEYQVVVPGHGASLPFLINEGIAMNFTRTYAQGLYHQRCGAECKMPYTRHVHGACHVTQAEIPSPQSEHAFTYRVITERNGDAKNEPRHTAPRIVDEASLLYPFINKGKIDVSLGHHDAGDYSKYMTNSAALAHLLMFTAENINGARHLDNLGLPESGDGISDIMQEAKHEADYIAKMQDADGGFYFLVYPKNRSYESDVSPDKGDTQVVWPKNTAGSAAATAALAQLGSSPLFKAAYPAVAADYLAKAKKGWQFITNAIGKYGKDGSYQKMTHYGHNFLHDDEIAWAAAELFLATGEEQYHRALKEWFPNPSDPATFRWGWWRLCESYGNAIRSYAFAARSGRIAASQLDAAYLAKCEEQIKLAGDDAVKWSNQSAYANSFPEATKHVKGAAWFFSLDQAADAAVAFQLQPKAEYTKALVGNMDYEGGSNPVNVPYLTGIGMKRQREIVHQWANNDTRGLPMNGIPQGNVQASYDMLWHYSASGNELQKLSFPTDDISSATTYPFYDRWADTWNVTTEFVVVNQARGLMAVAALATQTSAKNTAWKPTATATINVPAGIAATGVPVTLSLKTDGLDLTGARILWEARDQQADFGSTYTISPKNGGDQWVDAEITWPDGRRMYATGSFRANAALVNWVDDALPLGAQGSGSEPWTWVASPTPKLGSLAHQSKIASGLHEHAFQYALVPLEVSAGDTMFVWVYLDPANMPEQIMLSWNDGSWEHRAYWGADKIQYGTNGTASRFRAGDLPAGGQWVKLEVPAKAVGLEGSKITGMSFSAFGGRVTWDATGKTSPVN